MNADYNAPKSIGMKAALCAAVVGAGCANTPSLLRAEEPAPATERPNILMIAIDDLNDWVGCVDGHPQAHTPNIDRLAAMGVNFANAHCQTALCNPSRASVMTGVLPSTTGVYENLPSNSGAPLPTYWDRDEIATMGEHFGRHGYRTLGVGKIFHQCKWKDTFQEYGRGAHFDVPKERLAPPEAEGLEWGPHPRTNEETQDHKVAEWAIRQLKKRHDKPFFLAVGFIRPHEPFCVPPEWFELFGPVEEMQLPPLYDKDREDLPGNDLKIVTLENHLHYKLLEKHGLLKEYVHAYLACIAFVDHQIGKVLDALEKGPYADSTVIVLWSDHGYHLGEKERVRKSTLWERTSRVPFIIAGPGIPEGRTYDHPVALLDLFPTLCELSGTPALPQFEGMSLVPHLHDPDAPHPPVLVTNTELNHAIVSDRYRYIRYRDGAEEFYDLREDPNEWFNLASDPAYRELMDEHAVHLPEYNAKAIPRKPRKR
jgi:arylsulfatase A-like enzyme